MNWVEKQGNIDITSLADFLEKEKFQGYFDTYENYFKDVGDRVDNHNCIEHCEVLSNDGDHVILKCMENSARFRETDTVILNNPDTSKADLGNGFEMDWVSFDPITNQIILEKSFNNRRLPFPFQVGEVVNIDIVMNNLFDTTKETISRINRKKFINEYLSGQLEIHPVEPDKNLRNKIVSEFALTPSQVTAFDSAIGTYPISAIQGPPGTGKTYVLAAIACYYLGAGIDVLVTAVNHFAINNALNLISLGISNLGLSSNAVKVSKNKNTGCFKEVIKVNKIKNLNYSLRNSKNAYGLTPYKFRYELRDTDYKLLIMDEAAQATLPVAALAMSYVQKVVLIGDHKQMKPIINYKFHSSGLYRSVFEHHGHCYPDGIKMLTDTFRMNEGITSMPSKLFYNQRLHPVDDIKNNELNIKLAGNDLVDQLIDPKKPSVFAELDHKHCHKYSAEEAVLVTEILRRLVLKYGIREKDIAVLVPFRAQQMLIRKYLHILEKTEHGKFRSVIVDTVERMQGQERDIVIYSMTISDLNRLSYLAEAYFDPNKFNVAITRSRVKRIIVGSKNMLLTRAAVP